MLNLVPPLGYLYVRAWKRALLTLITGPLVALYGVLFASWMIWLDGNCLELWEYCPGPEPPFSFLIWLFLIGLPVITVVLLMVDAAKVANKTAFPTSFFGGLVTGMFFGVVLAIALLIAYVDGKNTNDRSGVVVMTWSASILVISIAPLIGIILVHKARAGRGLGLSEMEWI